MATVETVNVVNGVESQIKLDETSELILDALRDEYIKVTGKRVSSPDLLAMLIVEGDTTIRRSLAYQVETAAKRAAVSILRVKPNITDAEIGVIRAQAMRRAAEIMGNSAKNNASVL